MNTMPYRCVSCTVPLKTHRDWSESTPEQREGYARHATKGRCDRCYMRAKRGGEVVPTRPTGKKLTETEIKEIKLQLKRDWDRSLKLLDRGPNDRKQ